MTTMTIVLYICTYSLRVDHVAEYAQCHEETFYIINWDYSLFVCIAASITYMTVALFGVWILFKKASQMSIHVRLRHQTQNELFTMTDLRHSVTERENRNTPEVFINNQRNPSVFSLRSSKLDNVDHQNARHVIRNAREQRITNVSNRSASIDFPIRRRQYQDLPNIIEEFEEDIRKRSDGSSFSRSMSGNVADTSSSSLNYPPSASSS